MGQLSSNVPSMIQALCKRGLQVSWRPISPQLTCLTARGSAQGLNSRPAQPVTPNSPLPPPFLFLCLAPKLRRLKVRHAQIPMQLYYADTLSTLHTSCAPLCLRMAAPSSTHAGGAPGGQPHTPAPAVPQLHRLQERLGFAALAADDEATEVVLIVSVLWADGAAMPTVDEVYFLGLMPVAGGRRRQPEIGPVHLVGGRPDASGPGFQRDAASLADGKGCCRPGLVQRARNTATRVGIACRRCRVQSDRRWQKADTGERHHPLAWRKPPLPLLTRSDIPYLPILRSYRRGLSCSTPQSSAMPMGSSCSQLGRAAGCRARRLRKGSLGAAAAARRAGGRSSLISIIMMHAVSTKSR
jgi:hypothetical protein